jgi:hypothetical protein
LFPDEFIRHSAGEYVVGSIHTNSWLRTIFLPEFLSACERFGGEYEINSISINLKPARER